jgi:hypothetical protein
LFSARATSWTTGVERNDHVLLAWICLLTHRYELFTSMSLPERIDTAFTRQNRASVPMGDSHRFCAWDLVGKVKCG